MSRARLMIVLGLALFSGVVAGYLALTYLQPRVAERAAGAVEQTTVVLAARDVGAGTVLSGADVRPVSWPGSVVSPTYARSVGEVTGRGLMTDVRAGEPILARHLAPVDGGGGLPIMIPPGMRAVSVEVDEVIGVAGFVLPGTRVDVIVTLNPSNQRQDVISRVILQNVEALAAGQTIERDVAGAPQTVPVITLLVTPEEAEKLTLASNEGRITLALRNMLDREEIRTTGIRARELVGRASAPAAPRPSRAAARPRGTSVVTYIGSERTVKSFATE